jgi:hypothetical protein
MPHKTSQAITAIRIKLKKMAVLNLVALNMVGRK